MTTEAHNPSATPDPTRSNLALRFALSSGAHSIPLDRLHHLAGYATLAGDPEDYFLGWLTMRGEHVPVFDLNRVVCDRPTPEHFGSRILVLKAAEPSPTPYIGLLAAAVTDTISVRAASDESIEPLDIDLYLPMLYPLIPYA